MHRFGIVTILLCTNLVPWLDAGFVDTSLFNSDPKKNWAVLVAGSNGWGNYRHQADIYHAYQILRKHNIPRENIITFAFDDIADNRENPYPGKVFNDYNHQDVYKGVIIDYREAEVTAEQFLQVLRGDKHLEQNGKKVLKSGPEDNVFIYFSDHGSTSLIAFPSTVLYASQLNDTIHYMHENRMYNKMVLYVEACYSGTMFAGILPSNISVYATTAANTHESSWASFCDDRHIFTCLADEYSHNWLTTSEKHNPTHYTLDQQFLEVKQMTKKSHVSKFGEMSMGDLPVGDFQGHRNGESMDATLNKPKDVANSHPAHRAHLTAMTRRLMGAKTEAEHEMASHKLHRALQLGQIVKETFEDIILDVKAHYQPTLNGLSKTEELKCYEAVFDRFQIQCFTIQQVPEVAQYTAQLLQMCQDGYETKSLIESVQHVCS